MKKSLTKVLSLVLSLIMVIGLVSCNGKSKPSGDNTKKEDVHITWCFWDDLTATKDLMTKGYKDVIDRFNAADNGYHCDVITTNLEEYDSKMAALIAKGEIPDVWICNPGPNMDVYVNAGLCYDLTDVLKKDNPDWYNSFTKGIFERMTYNGKIMAVPTNFAAACCFYNTEIFQKAGVAVPKTFDEMLAACQKLKDAGYQPITCSAGTPWCLSMIAGYLCDRSGGPNNLVGITKGTNTWSGDPSYTKACENLAALAKFFQPSCASDTNDECVAQFYNEQAAMLVQGSWVIAQVNGANPNFESKCGVFQFPAVTGGSDPNRMIVKTDNLLVNKNTKHMDAVVELLKYFTDDTAQKYTAEVGGKIPVTSVSVDYDKAPKQLSFVMDILSKMTGSLGFYNESLASVEAGDTFDNAMVSIALGQKNVKDALAGLDQWYKDNVWK